MTNNIEQAEPVAPFVNLDDNDQPYLVGSKCTSCGQVHLGDHENCPRCAARGQMVRVRLGSSGTLYNYTIVHRSLPGVSVPFVSAVVDLDGGGTVRGNLLEVEPDPAKLEFGMAVKVIFDSATRAVDNGEGYLSHFFVPAN